MIGEMLERYDYVHSLIVSGSKVNFNINYLLDNQIYISIVSKTGEDELKYTYDFYDTDNFKEYVLPKIFERFLSKNLELKMRRVMADDLHGTLIVEGTNGSDSLIIRNCSNEAMDLFEILSKAIIDVTNIYDYSKNSSIIFNNGETEKFNNYIKYNIIFDYAKYKTEYNIYYDSINSVNTDGANEEEDDRSLFILNIARFAYTLDPANGSIWDQIEKIYDDNDKVREVCNEFRNMDDEYSLYSKALTLAEFEKNNDLFLHYNDVAVEEALKACDNAVDFFDNSYLLYWENKKRYYGTVLDNERQLICMDFIDAYDLTKRDQVFEEKGYDVQDFKESTNKKSVIAKLKEIKNNNLSFLNVDDGKDSNGDLIDIDHDEIISSADEEAQKIIEALEEREQLRKDAEEFAKTIIAKEREQKKIVEEARIQARELLRVKEENEELKRLARENAEFIFDRQRKLEEEEKLRQEEINTPVKVSDIDKINGLLNAISIVKDLDFAVNHPTVMQELTFLEEKINTYLVTHKNIVHEENVIEIPGNETVFETKPIIELLAMISNAYVSSHEFEKDGRHTVINFYQADDDTYRVTLCSVKDNSEDTLMDAFFEYYQLSDNVIEELCNIFKRDAVIVASKTDNVPPDKVDYLVIDNMDNAIRFIACPKDLIDRVKMYL